MQPNFLEEIRSECFHLILAPGSALRSYFPAIALMELPQSTAKVDSIRTSPTASTIFLSASAVTIVKKRAHFLLCCRDTRTSSHCSRAFLSTSSSYSSTTSETARHRRSDFFTNSMACRPEGSGDLIDYLQANNEFIEARNRRITQSLV